MRVRLHRLCQGTLIDISERGALAWLPIEQPPEKLVTLQIDWKSETILLPARIVRSLPHPQQSNHPVRGVAEYQVAFEFLNLAPSAVAILRQIVQEGQDTSSA